MTTLTTSTTLAGLPSCSEWARSQHLDPAGTAGHYKGFLLVEHPLPWPSDASLAGGLAGVSELAASAGLRLQLLYGERQPVRTGDGRRRVVCYRQVRQGWAGKLARTERVVPAGEVLEAATELVSAPVVAARPAGEDALVDVLVCTHGQRDACCGAKGMGLFTELVEDPLATEDVPVRLWRTSHTGGHRFAPSAVVLPGATMWAYADDALLREAARATAGEAGTAPHHYRGCATLGSPRGQALERAVFAEVGWALLRDDRHLSEAPDAPQAPKAPAGRLRLETRANGVWEGTVREARRVPQPECRSDPATATKYGVEWAVEDLRLVA